MYNGRWARMARRAVVVIRNRGSRGDKEKDVLCVRERGVVV